MDLPLSRSPTLSTLYGPQDILNTNGLENVPKEVEKQQNGDEYDQKGTGPISGENLQKDPFLVTLEDHAHISPQNWSSSFRWIITVIGGGLVLNSAFASAAPTQLLPVIAADYGIDMDVTILTISIYVAGYCVGPIFWGYVSIRSLPACMSRECIA